MTTTEITADRSWTILVHGYGAFEFRGTREAAEEAKANKCSWERASGRLWANDPQTEVERLEAQIGQEFLAYRGCSIVLLNRLRAAKQAAA